MIVEDVELSGVKLIKPSVYRDERGYLYESYQRERYIAHGVEAEFVQDNHSRSVKNALRGLHYQAQPGQAKLISVLRGRIVDVAVDIRPTSGTFGKWIAVELDADTPAQLFLPIGFAHGFCVLSDGADVHYRLSAPYDPATECGIAYNDAELGIDWPIREPLLSPRDRQNESFAAFRQRVAP